MTQKSVVLGMLREAGSKGVSVHELVYRKGITRAAAIVHDLRHNDGYDIITLDPEPLPDGRTALARYVLRNARRTLPPTPPIGFFDDEPLRLATPITFECGCIRSADAKSWTTRCDRHAGTPIEVQRDVQW